MAVEWKINGSSLESKRLTLVGGAFRTQGISFCTLDSAREFDAEEAFAHDDAVALQRVEGGVTVTFFQGKIVRIGKTANPDYEGHDYALEDAWADLEATTYQEGWSIGGGSYLVPRAVMGIGKNLSGTAYERIPVGKQIKEILTYAIGEGVDLQVGVIPDGEILMPEEESNQSCAELIRQCLRFHPDWLPWIDHTTTPPTFHVTPVATVGAVSGLTELTMDVSGSERISGLKVSRRDGEMPQSVRIFYEFATTIDNEVFRNGVIDKWPADGPDGGPRVLQASISLAGMKMQTQKSEVQVRPIPTGPTDPDVKSWLKKKFPHMALIPDAAFTVTKFDRSLLTETDAHPDPINPRAPRLEAENLDHLPNELIRGQINDWMRVRVGAIQIKIQVEKTGSWTTATAAERAAWKKGVRDISRMVATNAETKVYKGISQWVAPEEVPTGIAQAIYQSIHSGCLYEGTITVTESEISASRRYGRRLNLTGGDAGWTDMDAVVHSVDWDLASGRSTIGFGPVPELGPADFLEYQRILRQRPVTWWSTDERASNRIGGDGVPSAAGDTVGGYDGPQTTYEPTNEPGVAAPFSLANLRIDGADYFVTLHPGYLRDILPKGGIGVDGISFIMPQGGDSVPLDAATPPEFELALNDSLYLSYGTDKTGIVKGDPAPAVIVVPSADVPKKTTHYQPTAGDGGSGVDGLYYVRLGKLGGTGAEDATWQPFQNSDVEHYHDLFTGKNIGTGSSIFKERNVTDDSYEYRRVKGGFGVKNTQETSAVRLDFLATNIGGGHPVLIAPADPEDLGTGAAQFRTIRGLTETGGVTRQIKVELAPAEDGTGINQSILIRGNGVSGSNDAVTVDDGLVTEVKSPDEEGITADVILKDCTDPWDAATAPVILRLSFAGGKVVAIDAPIGTGTGERPLAATVFEKYVQSCHWIDDADHSHAV